jgi:hypothetical protein
MKKLTDKQVARKLLQAEKYAAKASKIVQESLGHRAYFQNLSFELHCKAVELQENAHWLSTGTDPIR